MTVTSLSLSPWSGIDTVHHETHLVFQPREGARAALTAAQNVDFDDEGLPTVRTGTTELVALTDGKEVFATPWTDIALYHYAGTVSSIDLSTDTVTSLITGLAQGLDGYFCEQAGKVFHSNGAFHSIITSATVASNWGMTIPPVATLGSTAGSLDAGRYRVACCFVDGAGTISGAPKAAAITVDGTEDIVVTLGSVDTNAVSVRIYASFTNAPDLYFVQQVLVAALPTVISDVSVSNEILDRQFLVGPQELPSIAGIGKWRGFLLLWNGTRIIHSDGNRHHLFDLRTAIWKLPYTIKAVAGTGDICWIATEKGLFNYIGSPPLGKISDPIDNRTYAAGSFTIAGSKLPFLDYSDGPVALFASSDGLVAGLPDGRVLYPHNQRLRWQTKNKKASFTYHEKNGLNQLLVNLG